MTKGDFKRKVLLYLSLHNIYPQKVRCFNTRRHGFEVRVYCPPMEHVTTRVSYRKKDWEIFEKDEQGRAMSFRKHGSCGHTIKTPMYIHINERDFADSDEMPFILQQIRDSALLNK